MNLIVRDSHEMSINQIFLIDFVKLKLISIIYRSVAEIFYIITPSLYCSYYAKYAKFYIIIQIMITKSKFATTPPSKILILEKKYL